MRVSKNPIRVKGYGRRRGRRAPRSSGKKGLTKLIKRVVRGEAETKQAMWYSGSSPQDGKYATSIPVSQNQFIQANATDILPILPYVEKGTTEYTRIGEVINPVSCKLHCKVMISPVSTGSSGWINGWAYDLTAVAYMLQHVSYKTYTSLFANNNFSQLLTVGDGQTTFFAGNYQNSMLPVEKGYYKVLAKKKIYLRSSGAFGGPTIPGGTTNSNSDPLVREWVWDVGKHLPKKLLYPQDSVVPAPEDNHPLNAAPFWCVGYYNTQGNNAATPVINIQQHYVTILRYKDM